MLSLISLFLLPLASASPIKPAIDPRDAAPAAGCTNTSFSDFAWTVRNFDYHASYTFTTPAHQNSWGYVNFELYNPADNSVATCSAASSQLSDFYYGTQQYVCDGSARPVGSPDTKFDFNRPNGTLRVEQGWRCRDQDPQYPITFNGKGAFNLTLDCQETFYQNPNWTIGQIYSSRNVQCKPVDVTVKPYEMTAVA